MNDINNPISPNSASLADSALTEPEHHRHPDPQDPAFETDDLTFEVIDDSQHGLGISETIVDAAKYGHLPH